MSSLWSRSSGKWRLIAFRVVSIWARCTKLGNSIFVQETKKICLSIKRWQWAILERGAFFSPYPANMKWNENVQWDRVLQAASDHLFLAPFSGPQPSVLHINAYGYIIKCTSFYIMHHVYCFSSRPQVEQKRHVTWQEKHKQVWGSLRVPSEPFWGCS